MPACAANTDATGRMSGIPDELSGAADSPHGAIAAMSR